MSGTKFLLFSVTNQRFLRGAKFWRWTRFKCFAAQFDERISWDMHLNRDYLAKHVVVIAKYENGKWVDTDWFPRGRATQ